MRPALAVAFGGALWLGCQRTPPPLESCKDSLAGLWLAEPPPGATLDPRDPPELWALLDRGSRLEGYPLFDDGGQRATVGAAPVTYSPRSLDLIRSHSSLLGRVQRWIMRGDKKCQLSSSVRITGCRGDAIAVQLGEPLPASEQLGELTDCPADHAPPAATLPPPRTWRRQP
jgi:hypothetical protein